MQPIINNPASRLHILLTSAQRYRGNGIQAWQAWCEILTINTDDYALAVTQIAKIYQLPSEIKEEIRRQRDINHEIYLSWMPKVIEAFKVSSWNAGMNNFADRIDDTVTQALSFCSDLLSRRSPEKNLSIKDLNEFWKELSKLSDDIFASDLDGVLKSYLLEHLGAMKSAIRDYKITGSKPIVAAYERIIGSIVTNSEVVERSSSTQNGKSFWEKIGRLGMMIGIAWNSLQIGDRAFQMLGNSDNENPITQDVAIDVKADVIILTDSRSGIEAKGVE